MEKIFDEAIRRVDSYTKLMYDYKHKNVLIITQNQEAIRKMSKRLNISLENDIAHALEKTSKELKEKKSKVIANALIFYFDYLDIKLAEERLKKLKEGKTFTISADQLYKELEI